MVFIKGFTERRSLGSSREKRFYIPSFISYIPIILGFVVFVYTILGLVAVMDRIIFFLAGGDTFLGLMNIYLLLIGSLISIGIFFLGTYLLSRSIPEKTRSRKENAFWRFGFLLSSCLLLLSTMLCLFFLIWLIFASFPLLYTGIRIGVVYTILFLILVWRSIAHFARFKKERI